MINHLMLFIILQSKLLFYKIYDLVKSDFPTGYLWLLYRKKYFMNKHTRILKNNSWGWGIGRIYNIYCSDDNLFQNC